MADEMLATLTPVVEDTSDMTEDELASLAEKKDEDRRQKCWKV